MRSIVSRNRLGRQPRRAGGSSSAAPARSPAPSCSDRRSSPRAAATTTTTAAAAGAAAVAATGPRDLELDRLHDRPVARRLRGRRPASRSTTPRTSTTTTSTSRRSGPNLSQGEGIGRDGMVLTDWMASRLINQVDPPWVQPFDDAEFPNKANLVAALAVAGVRPARARTARRGRAGITGHRVQHRARPARRSARSTTSSPSSGTKTVLTEMRDTVGLFMLATGADPTKPDVRQLPSPRSTRCEKAVDDGQIDGFNGNDYVADLGAGNLAAAFAWSGDVAQITLDNPDVRFAVPETRRDALVRQLPHPDRHRQGRPRRREWINFFYDPENAAVLTAGIQFISPVAGRRRSADGDGRRRGRARRQPARRADRRVPRVAVASSGRSTRRTKRSSTSGSPRSSARADARSTSAGRERARRRGPPSAAGVTPWLLLAPGMLWLLAVLLRPALHAVPDVAVGAHRPLLGPDVQLGVGELRRRVLAVRRPVLPVVPLRRDRDAARAADRVPARVRDRVPRRTVRATCCSASSSCRSSRTS